MRSGCWTHSLSWVVLLIVAWGGDAAYGQAVIGGQKYAVVALRNKTDTTLNYSYRWGTSGSWRRITLRPGQSWWHSWNLTGGGTAPSFSVRFDSDLTSNRDDRQVRLTPRLAGFEGYEFARKHYFYRGTGARLRLVTTTD